MVSSFIPRYADFPGNHFKCVWVIVHILPCTCIYVTIAILYHVIMSCFSGSNRTSNVFYTKSSTLHATKRKYALEERVGRCVYQSVAITKHSGIARKALLVCVGLATLRDNWQAISFVNRWQVTDILVILSCEFWSTCFYSLMCNCSEHYVRMCFRSQTTIAYLCAYIRLRMIGCCAHYLPIYVNSLRTHKPTRPRGSDILVGRCFVNNQTQSRANIYQRNAIPHLSPIKHDVYPSCTPFFHSTQIGDVCSMKYRRHNQPAGLSIWNKKSLWVLTPNARVLDTFQTGDNGLLFSMLTIQSTVLCFYVYLACNFTQNSIICGIRTYFLQQILKN